MQYVFGLNCRALSIYIFSLVISEQRNYLSLPQSKYLSLSRTLFRFLALAYLQYLYSMVLKNLFFSLSQNITYTNLAVLFLSLCLSVFLFLSLCPTSRRIPVDAPDHIKYMVAQNRLHKFKETLVFSSSLDLTTCLNIKHRH